MNVLISGPYASHKKTTHRLWLAIFCLLICAYSIWIFWAQKLRADDTLWMTAPMLLGAFAVCSITAILSNTPARQLGLIIGHWKFYILIATVASLIIILLAIFFKAYWVSGTSQALINWSDHLLKEHWWIIPVYLLMIPMQNFIFRACLQSVLMDLARNQREVLLATVIASLIYSGSHLHISPALALATVLPGLVWGWLYAYTRSLLAPTLSHAVSGLVIFYVIGFHELTNM
ncbi:MAG: CPBP family intramembrane glutamic endopeptidase [Pseudomonadota bacterium]